MDEPKWEDLNQDCLVNIFGRVGMESLLLDVPFVCKSWHKVTLNPGCWHHLDFREILLNGNGFVSRLMDESKVEGSFSDTEFIKSIVKRSDRSATFLALPRCCTEEVLLFVADECPGLMVLVLPLDLPGEHVLKIPNLVSKWKNLEFLRLGSCYQMQEILAQISIHCEKFGGLAITGAYIGEDEASAIVTLVPHIKYLILRHASMEKEYLVMILEGCKELVHFDARDCIGFDEGDGEILMLASHISRFMHEGSVMFIFDDLDPPNYRDDGFHDGNISD